jgi:hypoxanthine phosphoribosyltransferase
MRDPTIGEILVQPDELKERVRALGEQVTAEYIDRDLLLVGVL